ncbi:hypothetical protein chiPu_0033161, partial [Chiloscyllium punctatum]|nr:hypothetical protein [Chiloscyllium punctatum]
ALEQEKHEQRRKFEARESEWQACLVELEAELAQRSGQWQRERQQEQRSRDETVLHLVTQNQRLLDELSEVPVAGGGRGRLG